MNTSSTEDVWTSADLQHKRKNKFKLKKLKDKEMQLKNKQKPTDINRAGKNTEKILKP